MILMSALKVMLGVVAGEKKFSLGKQILMRTILKIISTICLIFAVFSPATAQNAKVAEEDASIISREVGGVGPFYFGMPYSDAVQTLRILCDYVDSEVSGERCGSAYGELVDIEIESSQNLWFANKLKGITLKLPYSEKTYSSVISDMTKRFGSPTSSMGCNQGIKNVLSCTRFFSHSLEVWTFSFSEKNPETIDISFRSFRKY